MSQNSLLSIYFKHFQMKTTLSSQAVQSQAAQWAYDLQFASP